MTLLNPDPEQVTVARDDDDTNARQPASAKILTTTDGRRYVLYRGSRNVTQYLWHLPGARVYDWGCTLALPATRENLMVLEVLGELEEADEEYAAAVRELLQPSAQALALYPPSAPSAPEPRPHQRATFGWSLDALIAKKRGFLNACCLGSGKTRMAIDFMRYLNKAGISLVVGQKTTLEQWREELTRAWPEAETHVLHQVGKGTISERAEHLARLRQGHMLHQLGRDTLPGRSNHLAHLGRGSWDRPQVILTNWEALAPLEKDLQKLPKFDVIVADEASNLIGRTTQRARAAKQLAWKHAWYTLALTGTPIRRGVEDLLALFQFIDTSVFGSRIADFRRQYCEEVWRKGQIVSVPRQDKVVELVQRLYSAGYRVSRAAVDLPEPERRVVQLAPAEEQREHLRRLSPRRGNVAMGEEDSAANVLTRILRMQQVTAGFTVGPCDAPAAEHDGEHDEVLAPRCLDDPKADWIEAYLADVLPTEDAHVIVWTRFIPEIEALHARLDAVFPRAVARIDGSTPDAERQEVRRRFNDRQDPLRVLVMNLQTGSLGLDLPACDVMLYHSSTYAYVDRIQSEGRGTRLGRTKSCQIVDLVLTGTIDEDILDVIAQKKSVSDLLVGEGFTRRTTTK